MVLAPLVLTALAVLIEKKAAVAAEADRLGRSAQHLFDTSAPHGHTIKFGHRRFREQGTGGRILDRGYEKNIFPIGREGRGDLRGGIEGDPPGGTALGRHDI